MAAALPGIAGTALAVFAVGGVGSWVLSRRLRRQTRGLETGGAQPADVEYHEAVLHAVREGLLLVDGDSRVLLVNDEGRRLLSLDDDPVGRSVEELDLPPDLTENPAQSGARGRRGAPDRLAGARGQPGGGAAGDRSAGTVVTLRDHTELQALTGELDSVRAFAEALRSQAHEAANRLHTTVSLVDSGAPRRPWTSRRRSSDRPSS